MSPGSSNGDLQKYIYIYINEKLKEIIFNIELHQDILHFCNEKTPILLTGDFNGRTGTLNDVYVDGNFTEHPITHPSSFPELPLRRNCDTHSNSHGRKIIQVCQTFDFKILNGEHLGIKLGTLLILRMSWELLLLITAYVILISLILLTTFLYCQ